MAFYLRLALGLTVFAGVQVAVLAGGDYSRGQGLYQNLCVACHSIAYNGVGPAHKNLFGRKAGSLPDYGYSPALASAGIVWNAATLDRWLLNPEKLVPGQKWGSWCRLRRTVSISLLISKAQRCPRQCNPETHQVTHRFTKRRNT